MNIKNTLMVALLAGTALTAQAQEPKAEYEALPHWYIQGQIGGQYTLGEIDFGDLISPNAQVAVGYNFGSVVGARFAVNAWQSRGGSEIMDNTYKWKYNYVAPSLQATFNLSNLISGVNPKRLVDISAFVGGGVNIAFSNDEAVETQAELISTYGQPVAGTDVEGQYLRYLWDGTKVRGFGTAGLDFDFKVAKRLTVGLELSANVTTDHYNSKKAGNADWYFNGLVGVKYAFGDTYKEKDRPAPPEPKIVYKDRIVEKIVEKPVEKEVVKAEKLRVDVFFTISATKILGSEEFKVQELADYMKKHESTKCTITGLADKGTGTDKINIPLSQKRAKVVKDLLVNKYGIDESRISAEGKGSSEQPFSIPVLNRVSICVAE